MEWPGGGSAAKREAEAVSLQYHLAVFSGPNGTGDAEEHMIPLLWLDLETTGLDPKEDAILEIAIVATDAELRIEGMMSLVLPWPIDKEEELLLPRIIEMHSKNGLFQAVRKSEIELPMAHCVAWVVDHHFEGRPMAGSNPEFDRAFIGVQMPYLAKQFHYRSFDMNTLYAYFGTENKPGGGSHRACDDIMRDITELRKMHNKMAYTAGGLSIGVNSENGKG